MRRFVSVLFPMLILIALSCERDFSETPGSDQQVSDNLLKSRPGAVYPDLLVPEELVKQYLENGNSKPIEEWLKAKTQSLEQKCRSAEDCKDKLDLMDRLLFIESQKDLLGLGEIESTDALCNGLNSIENTFIDVMPSNISLEVGEQFDLAYEIVTGDSKCEGDVTWLSDNENIATVDQAGKVTAIAAGSCRIHAIANDLTFVQGSAEVVVSDDKQYDIVLVMENGYGVDWLVGVQPGWPGVKQLSNEIAALLIGYFGSNYRFGLVGFDHYPILPWGVSLGGCYAVENNVPEYEPLISMSEYHPYLDLTDNSSDIKSALAGVKMMCTWHEYPANWATSAFTAVIKTMQNYDWDEDSEKFIILYGSFPATYLAGSGPSGAEGYSGYTIANIASIAAEKSIKIFTISGFNAREGNIAEAVNAEYLSIAQSTGGEYYTGGLPSTLEPLNFMFGRIKNSSQ